MIVYLRTNCKQCSLYFLLICRSICFSIFLYFFINVIFQFVLCVDSIWLPIEAK